MRHVHRFRPYIEPCPCKDAEDCPDCLKRERLLELLWEEHAESEWLDREMSARLLRAWQAVEDFE